MANLFQLVHLLCFAAVAEVSWAHDSGDAYSSADDAFTIDDECRGQGLAELDELQSASCSYSALQRRARQRRREGSIDAGEEHEEGDDEYDVVVIGGGLVGSVVAAKLSDHLEQAGRQGGRILLLEAGKASQFILGGREPPASWNDTSKRWDAWPGLQGSDLTKFDVPGNYEALQCWEQDCPETWGSEVPGFACKVLGGCGVMNGALMQLPQDANFANWPRGWQAADFAPYYSAAQSMYHITADPSADHRHYLDETGGDLVRSAFLKGGYRFSSDLRPAAKKIKVPHVSAKNGIRQSSTSVLLPKRLHRRNLQLRLESEVMEIMHSWNGSAAQAWGVRFRSATGANRTVRLKAGGLVVLSAGALNTPRLLLASRLTGGGHVGKGLSDHTLRQLVYKPELGPQTLGDSESFGIKPPTSSSIRQYLETRSGPLAQFGPTLTAFIRDPSTPGVPEEYDVELWVDPLTKPGAVHASAVLMRPTCSKANLTLGSDGRLRQSGNLRLACDRDNRTLEFAIQEVDRWLGEQGARRVYTSSEEAMNHFVGTCALGACAAPEDLRVRGAANVAVADASLLPGQVWGHPALTLTALGLKAADVLKSSLGW